jgi:hypothetical protein
MKLETSFSDPAMAHRYGVGFIGQREDPPSAGDREPIKAPFAQSDQ